jgi:hypothetical protein
LKYLFTIHKTNISNKFYLTHLIQHSTSIFIANAQDIIVKNDKTEIKAKIEELTETTIKYKKIEMLDGPSYNINKRDVFMIIYKNGTKEYIESSTSIPAQTPIQNNPSIISTNTTIQGSTSVNTQQTQSGVGHTAMKKIRKGYYEFEGKRLKTFSEYRIVFEKYGYKDLVTRHKEAVLTRSIIVGAAGVTSIVGLAIGNDGLFYGGAIGTLLTSFITTGMRDNVIKEFNSRATIKVGFNSKHEIRPMMSGNSVGISIGL